MSTSVGMREIVRPEIRTHSEYGAPASHPALSPVRLAAWHGLFWLVIANVIGVWLALLLLVPNAGSLAGSWSYGRWMPIHLNLQLYGWISLPLIAWLIKVFGADRPPIARWTSTAVWLWSAALLVGAASWLNGQTSGKLFLDWSGYSRILFPTAILFLWGVFATSLATNFRASAPGFRSVGLYLRGLGMLLLLAIPFAIYFAANPAIYPPVNPDSGGPTAASQLESVLVIVLILFLLPYGITERNGRSATWITTGWVLFAVEALLCLGLGRADVSHRRPTQFLSLGSLLVWVPLMPAYYRAFRWPEHTRNWRLAVLAWWALLIPTGWTLFLPGVLDRLKFTDGLVSHSLLAMAGFVTNLLILLLVMLLGDEDASFTSGWVFAVWQAATFLYVALMLGAGWIEGADPTFTIIPSPARNALYLVRFLLGAAMTLASADWLFRLTKQNFSRHSGTAAPVSHSRQSNGGLRLPESEPTYP